MVAIASVDSGRLNLLRLELLLVLRNRLIVFVGCCMLRLLLELGMVHVDRLVCGIMSTDTIADGSLSVLLHVMV